MIEGKNGSASSRAEASSATGNWPSLKPKRSRYVRHQVDAGHVRLGLDPALGEVGDDRVAVGPRRQPHGVDEPAAPLGAAVGARQHEAGGIALAGGRPVVERARAARV